MPPAIAGFGLADTVTVKSAGVPGMVVTVGVTVVVVVRVGVVVTVGVEVWAYAPMALARRRPTTTGSAEKIRMITKNLHGPVCFHSRPSIKINGSEATAMTEAGVTMV